MVLLLILRSGLTVIRTCQHHVHMCPKRAQCIRDPSLNCRKFCPTIKSTADTRLIGHHHYRNVILVARSNYLADPSYQPHILNAVQVLDLFHHNPIAIQKQGRQGTRLRSYRSYLLAPQARRIRQQPSLRFFNTGHNEEIIARDSQCRKRRDKEVFYYDLIFVVAGMPTPLLRLPPQTT